MSSLTIPKDVIRGQRRIGYAGVKNWVRRTFGIDEIGERDYFKYQEPSDRWDEAIRRSLYGYNVYALGITRNPTPNTCTELKLISVQSIEDWWEFLRDFKALIVVRKFRR